MKTLLEKSVRLAKAGKRPKITRAILGVGVEVDMDSEGNYILPTASGAAADLLYRARERRLEMQRETERVEKLEKQLKEFFINTLPLSESSGIAGAEARVQITTSRQPQVEDWDKFYAYVRRNNAFEFLQRRVNEGAVKERWEDRKEVPGVTAFNVKKVSVTKL
jgi:hypothetical protein